jgi:DNA-binding SARP family transcriptional activator
LRGLTARHPLRERFHTQLMLALAVAGRQAEALAAYQHARRVLVEQLGIEPGAELRTVQARIQLPAAVRRGLVVCQAGSLEFVGALVWGR